MLDRRRLGGQTLTLGFMSAVWDQNRPEVPNYGEHLLVLVNDRLLGDGYALPSFEFKSEFLTRHLAVSASDGWEFDIRYSKPWFRELFRKINAGGTLESDPVDFTECVIEAISFNRPAWVSKANIKRMH
jgi:hypothetical protein